MALKNKLSLLCLGIIATNFIVNNNASAMNDLYNNKPLYNCNYSITAKPIFNKPFAEDITKPLSSGQYSNKWNSGFSGNNWYDSNNSTDTDSDNNSKLRILGYKPKFYSNFNIYKNGWNSELENTRDKVNIPVYFDIKSTPLNTNSILTNFFTSRSHPTNESRDYENHLLTVLAQIIKKGCEKDLTQLGELCSPFPKNYLFSVVRSVFGKFYLYDSDTQKQLDDFFANSTVNYLNQQSTSYTNSDCKCFLRLLNKDLNYFNNMQSANNLVNLVSTLYSNNIFTLILNDFISEMSTKSRQQFCNALKAKISRNGSPNVGKQLKSYITELIASMTIHSLVEQNNNINLGFSEFLRNCYKESDYLWCLTADNDIANQLANTISVIKNLKARELCRIEKKYANASVQTLLGKDNPEQFLVALMQLYCKCVNKKRLNQYNNNLYNLLTNKQLLIQMRDVALANWSKYNNLLGVTHFSEGLYDNEHSITATDFINLSNWLIEQANSSSSSISNAANNWINHIMNYANTVDQYGLHAKDGYTLLQSLIIYQLSNDPAIANDQKKFSLYLSHNNFGIMHGTLHTTSNSNKINPVFNARKPWDFDFILQVKTNRSNNKQLQDNIYFSKAAWNSYVKNNNKLTNDLIQSISDRNNLNTKTRQLIVRSKIGAVINRELFKQRNFDSTHYVLSKSVLKNVVYALFTENRNTSINNPLHLAIDAVIENASYKELFKILQQYIITSVNNPQISDPDKLALIAFADVVSDMERVYRTFVTDFKAKLLTKLMSLNNIRSGSQQYKNKIAEIENDIKSDDLVQKYVSSVLGSIDTSLTNNQYMPLVQKLLSYSVLFCRKSQQVSRVFLDAWRSKVPNAPHQFNNDVSTFNAQVRSKVFQANHLNACLEYLTNPETNFGRVISSDVYSHVSNEFGTKSLEKLRLQYLQKIISNNSLFYTLQQVAIAANSVALYKDEYINKLNTWKSKYFNYITRVLNRSPQISGTKLATLAVDEIIEIFTKVFRNNILDTNNNRVLQFLSSVKSNKDRIIKCIANTITADKRNSNINSMTIKMKDLFEVYFLIDGILNRKDSNMERLLSETDLNVAKITNDSLLPAFLNGYQTDFVQNNTTVQSIQVLFNQAILKYLKNYFQQNISYSSARTTRSTNIMINI